MGEVNKRVFEVAGKAYAVVRPPVKVARDAQRLHSRVFAECVKAGALVRPAVERVMREQRLWDDEKAAEVERAQKALWDGQKKLKAGGKLSEGRAVALDMRLQRARLRDLLAERNALDLHTAEAQADQAEFDHKVAHCTVREGGKEAGTPAWKDLDAYRADAEGELALKAASEMSKLLYGLDDDWAKRLPENAWLLEHGLCNEKLRLTDREGNLVDADWNRVDERGRRLNADGVAVDEDGCPLDEEGNPLVEQAPFVDDLGGVNGEEKKIISSPPPSDEVAEEAVAASV